MRAASGTLILLLLPLSGCVQGEEDAGLEAFTATYEGSEHILHVSLDGPHAVMDADGRLRDAYRFSLDHEVDRRFDQVLWLDGSLRPVRYDIPCFEVEEGECVRHKASYLLQGSPAFLGVGLLDHVRDDALTVRVADHTLRAKVSTSEENGLLVLHVRGIDEQQRPPGALLNGDYAFGDHVVPEHLRLVEQGRVVEQMALTSYESRGSLQEIPGWPLGAPTPPVPGTEAVYYPGDGAPIFGMAASPREVLDEARRENASFDTALRDCIVRIDVNYVKSIKEDGLSPFKVRTLAALDIVTLRESTETTWRIEVQESDLDGRRVLVDRRGTESGGFSCASARRVPAPAVAGDVFVQRLMGLDLESVAPSWFSTRLDHSVYRIRNHSLGGHNHALYLEPVAGGRGEGGVRVFQPYVVVLDANHDRLVRWEMHPGDVERFEAAWVDSRN